MKRNPLSATIVCLVACLLLACTSQQKKPNIFADADLVKIADHQDKRATDSLLPYLTSKNALHRERAAFAFASVQDSAAVDALARCLEDPEPSVRRVAALALGQTFSSRAGKALASSFSAEKDSATLQVMLEGYGKQKSANVAAATAFANQPGFAWMLYRMGLAGSTDSTLARWAVRCLQPDKPEAMRLGAAHYFARTRATIDTARNILLQASGADSSPEVRMACILALRKIKGEQILATLKTLAVQEPDYRVRVSIVRALQSVPLDQSLNILVPMLKDANVNVGIAVSELIKTAIAASTADAVWEAAQQTDNVRIKADLYGAVLATRQDKKVAQEIQQAYEVADSDYDRASWISALSAFPPAYEFVADIMLNADAYVLKSTAAAALTSMNAHASFPADLQPAFADLYKRAVQGGDAAVIGTVCGALADPALGYRNIITDVGFLKAQQKKLVLPRENETMQALESALAFLENREAAPIVNAYNHPIDWNLVRAIPSELKAVIKTHKGNITIQLDVNAAPGTVANFVQQARAHYFDHKFFHRVVPNFVVQAGCNRGDGWGSEDYSIRSEFSSLRYHTGAVGMASAGKDTEGLQWFITHSPTPHLDGRYSIFAYVIDGMDVVHQIEVGDEIVSVNIQD